MHVAFMHVVYVFVVWDLQRAPESLAQWRALGFRHPAAPRGLRLLLPPRGDPEAQCAMSFAVQLKHGGAAGGQGMWGKY